MPENPVNERLRISYELTSYRDGMMVPKCSMWQRLHLTFNALIRPHYVMEEIMMGTLDGIIEHLQNSDGGTK